MALVMVLVMMVIGSLIVIPTMTYAVSVMRANTTLSEKTKRVEAVKAGLRIALADPTKLYHTCDDAGQNVSIDIAGLQLSGVNVTTKCYMIGQESAQSAEQIRYGITATRLGEIAPSGLSGNVAPAMTTTTDWWSHTSLLSETNKIWQPNLASHGLDRRPAAGTEMPAGFQACTVYFPGTYVDPVVLDGPTYFASGIYYFEDTVTVIGGASVVVGLGGIPGCTSDQEAVFYAQTVPSTHNISGLGATWVLGKKARVVVDNTNNTALSLQFNARYVAPGEAGDAPSADVSIISVNGDLAADGVTGTNLSVPGVIDVPLSLVGSENAVPATSQRYVPSVYTPKPARPDAPTGVAATRYVGAARITWTAPYEGGSPITGYTVTASSNGATCTTAGATTCAITGLPSSSTTFTVVANNAAGSSAASAPSTAVTPGGTTSMVVPTKPATPTIKAYLSGAVQAKWTAPTDGGAPIKSYTVTASSGQTCTVTVDVAVTPPLACNLTLAPLAILGTTFTVTATNAVGTSLPSNASGGLTALQLLAGVPDAIIVPTPSVTYRAIIDVNLPSASAVTVDIPGYVSVPQGRFNLNNPNALDVEMRGAVLAAEFDVVDARIQPPTAPSIPVGFVETEVQRKFRLVTSSNRGHETSTAIVQVNQNGAYAINSWEVQ